MKVWKCRFFWQLRSNNSELLSQLDFRIITPQLYIFQNDNFKGVHNQAIIVCFHCLYFQKGWTWMIQQNLSEGFTLIRIWYQCFIISLLCITNSREVIDDLFYDIVIINSLKVNKGHITYLKLVHHNNHNLKM